MPIQIKGTAFITELMESVTEAPDFSFLNDWKPAYDSTFFPRLNNSPQAEARLDGEDRKKLRVAIDAVREVDSLVDDATLEATEDKGHFSNSIRVFYRDGEASVVAIPVTEQTERALGGFLFSQDVLGIPNSDLFLSDLKMLTGLTESAEGFLKWRWWPVNKETRHLNKRNASQLLLAATNPGNRNVHHIAELVESRASISSGRALPQLNDWHQSLLKLESLQDFPSDAVVSSIDLEHAEDLSSALETIRSGFIIRDEYMAQVKSALTELTEERTRLAMANLSLETFAQKVKGKGFQLKLISSIMAEHGLSSNCEAVIELAKTSPDIFNTKPLRASVQMIYTYREDQKRLLGYPRLTDRDEYFENFMRLLYRFYLEQQRPYPARAQFETLDGLLESNPKQLHLLARSEESLKRLVGSLESYIDEHRLEGLRSERVEPTTEEARAFFNDNPATYQTLLSSLGLNALTLEQLSGFLAPELTKALREIEIELSMMKSPLRSYQLFGAQYAFHQKRTILGDEMGLGKTVTALALASHLHSEGDQKFLVISPLAVLENWRREIAKHTDFESHVLYGDELEENLENWMTTGGIALATYESIQKVNQSSYASSLSSPALVIVDEAHFIKNPETKRSQSVLPWIRSAARVMLLTGTPLENKLEEFITLIGYVQPQLEISDHRLEVSEFRKAIAPAYLRRNQVDVLQELPELQDDEEYIELTEADIENYKRALASGDWNGARKAKLQAGNRSSTVQRIQAIVDESIEADHKVLVFSYYRDNIDILQKALKHDDPYIPLTGSLSSIERQNEVDKFTKSSKPGVLLAQSVAGGTGLNIQSASVIIIVEPQSKPSIEAQMIRRAYRMGQTKPVRVIRLRAKNTLDERWVRMLQEKSKIFDATAGVSDAALLDTTMSGTSANLFSEEREFWGV